MDFTGKKIGIWGFGITGRSMYEFLRTRHCFIEIMDNNPTTLAQLKQHNLTYCTQEDQNSFLERNDFIIPSAGIDIRALYEQYKNKWLFELDLFFNFFHKPIIAVTGTVGKTTITSFLSQLLRQYDIQVATGGNIGIGALDLIKQQDSVTYGILETADIQLKYVHRFAPTLAIWTSFFPNHLNWHNSLDDYFKAKCNIFLHQHSHNNLLIPLEIAPAVRALIPHRRLHIFTDKPLSDNHFIIQSHDSLYYLEQHTVMVNIGNSIISLFDIRKLPPISFTQNWLIIISSLHILGLPLEKLAQYASHLTLPKHRFEKIITLPNNITFYNDSKSTTIESTRAALNQLDHPSIRLFLGGLSKGVDRSHFIQTLSSRVTTIYCFGKEAAQLHNFCTQYSIPSYCFDTLTDAFNTCVLHMKPGDQILFSPAGSSYDLFKNFEERGDFFKKLVHDYVQHKDH